MTAAPKKRELGYVAEVTSGQSAPQDPNAFGDTGRPFIRAGSLERLLNGGNEEDLEHIPDNMAERFRMRLFPPDTIVFAKSGMSAKIGRVYRLKTPCYVVSHLAAVIPGDDLIPGYLQRWLEKHPPSRLIPNDAYPSIRVSAISALKIPLPTPDEQERVAAILDKADAIRRKRADALRLADEFLKSAFIDIFGDPVTNPKEWDEFDLGEYLDFLTSGSRGWAQYYSTEGEKFLRIQNVGRNELILDDLAHVNAPDNTEAKRTRVRPGDVLLSITADLGRTAVIPESFGTGFINQHLALLRVREISPLYLSAYLASEGGQRQFRRLNREGVKAGLNFDDIRSLSILRPPLKEQQKYQRLWNYQQQHVEKHLAFSFEVDQLFNSLIQRAFKGEL